MATLLVCLGFVACHAQSQQSGERQSARRSLTLLLHAEPDRALRAFGPVEEKKWAPEWDPKFISIEGDAADPDFAIFNVTHGTNESIWTLSSYDRKRGIMQYVVVNPGKMVTVIDIRCASADQRMTRATVTYRKAALTPEMNPQVSDFAQHFTEQRDHWEQTLNRYFQTGNAHQ